MIDDRLESVYKLWELNAIGIIPEQPSPDDVCTYNQYLETVQHNDGQYWLKNKFIKVVKLDNKQKEHFLTHMAVIRESKTTPLWIVFNCSSKSGPQGTSLNDCLQTGPSLTQKLYDILLKFRLNKYAFSIDISKVFLRVGLQEEEEKEFTKFLWVENPEDLNSPIVTCRFCSVLFGATSSPFLLQAALDTHLKKSSSPYEADNSKSICR
ncbi:uncharacterized protein [Procambarus clarkii]|uniref:uncharacterized protein n=1 Tax=Procambarus clarkii TaxID=6728 RepID=UPI003742CF19